MNKNKKITPKESRLTMNAERSRKLVIIIAAVFVGIAVIFGIVLGTVAIVKRASYVAFSGSEGISDGVANYLISYYKALCIKNINLSGHTASDTEEFWSKVYDEQTGETFGNYLDSYVEVSIKKLIAANVLFDSVTSLSASDKEKIEKVTEEKLYFLCGGNKSKFNEMAKEYGFDYKDYEKASLMLYKYANLSNRICGEGGTNLLKDLDFCESFFEKYSRVKFVFIRTEDTYKKDGDGAYIIENGSYVMRELTDEERAKRQSHIDELSLCIEEIEEGIRDPEGFDDIANEIFTEYGEISSNELDGYYLYEKSDFTRAFCLDFPEISEVAMGLSVGEFGFAEYESGVCFMYRDEAQMGTYPYYYDDAEDGFFGDFLSLASVEFINLALETYSKDVTVTEKFISKDMRTVKYTTKFIPSFA